MNLDEICEELSKRAIRYDVVWGTIRAYCGRHGKDFDVIRMGPDGGVEINGRIADFQKWLGE